jgi:hypothetical protein
LLPSGISPIERVVSSSSSLVFRHLERISSLAEYTPNVFHRWLSIRGNV